MADVVFKENNWIDWNLSLPARGLAGVDTGCVPPPFVLDDRPAPASGPGAFPGFDLVHAPDCNPGPHSVFN
ncbi:hypothetical protein EVAR_55944_1 [Eumeta japonica]|uniref:Uncharacterized protein n=1 Tax=Eumeta variegata TaxID=151549 RepID=A0A4C1YX27_EUMVA|nr:hypothetical protein EVAR_55944_1 [Eumeta japonica]